MTLTGTRVLVTGGTSGLGRAMADALVRAGARVAVTSRDGERARATAAELGAGALGAELDVRDARSVSAAVDGVYETLGGLDVLVNNAGIGMRTVNPRFMTDPQPFWELAPARFRDVLETKVTGTHRQHPAARRSDRDGDGARRPPGRGARQPPRPGDHGPADRLAGLRGRCRGPRRADRRPRLRRATALEMSRRLISPRTRAEARRMLAA